MDSKRWWFGLALYPQGLETPVRYKMRARANFFANCRKPAKFFRKKNEFRHLAGGSPKNRLSCRRPLTFFWKDLSFELQSRGERKWHFVTGSGHATKKWFVTMHSADFVVDGDELVRRAALGQQSARNELFLRYRPYLKLMTESASCFRFGARFDSSDIVQQVCFQAIRSLEDFRGEGIAEFEAWISRILSNTLSAFMRMHFADARDIRRESSLPSHATDSVAIPWRHLADHGLGPEQRVIRGEAALVLASALMKLPRDRRIAIELRFLHGLMLREISNHMSRSTDAIAGLIHRGLQDLLSSVPAEVFPA